MNQLAVGRRHTLPRRWYRYAELFTLSPRQRYILEQSKARYDRRLDAMPDGGLFKGEVGRFNGITIIGCDFGRELDASAELAHLDAFGNSGPFFIPPYLGQAAVERYGRLPRGIVVMEHIPITQVNAFPGTFEVCEPMPIIGRGKQKAQWKRERSGRR